MRCRSGTRSASVSKSAGFRPAPARSPWHDDGNVPTFGVRLVYYGREIRFPPGRSLRSCEEIGWQAEAPAPPRCKSFECNVGQTLSSVNPAVRPISSQLLTLAVPNGATGVRERPAGGDLR